VRPKLTIVTFNDFLLPFFGAFNCLAFAAEFAPIDFIGLRFLIVVALLITLLVTLTIVLNRRSGRLPGRSSCSSPCSSPYFSYHLFNSGISGHLISIALERVADIART